MGCWEKLPTAVRGACLGLFAGVPSQDCRGEPLEDPLGLSVAAPLKGARPELSRGAPQVSQKIDLNERQVLAQVEAYSFFEGFTCPWCKVTAETEKMYASILETYIYVYGTAVFRCASCGKNSVYVVEWRPSFEKDGTDDTLKRNWVKQVSPAAGRIPGRFPNTPAQFIKPYAAACGVLEVSPEASATMSRRCLEMLLTERGYAQQHLVQKIEALLKETDPRRHLPVEVHECVDAVRNFGNFGAHPITDKQSHSMIEVEPGEAEWCIEIVEQLFKHWYERPAIMAGKLAEVNKKLTAAGKPPAKK